ncbi:tRNA-dihydrouridine synthase [Candidatus Peregrinibacteria bacterium]|nr:tRNA-dihydrouridine synthase [Candidatus Peregrinibacteria bacterium]
MDTGFWGRLERPIIGLAPMDGVTDAAYRLMTARHGKPSLFITEFVNVEGLARGAIKILRHLMYDESERYVVAQIYGVEPESFYKVALLVCELGFDGIDINMGCPADKIARRGSGAGLIRTPETAKALIRITKQAVSDWANGKTMEEAGIRPKIIREVKKFRDERRKNSDERRETRKINSSLVTRHSDVTRNLIPISVKTRIGYDRVIVDEWIKYLLEVSLAAISLHGRTFKQLYSGAADWEMIASAARLCKGTGTLLLGNGDIRSMEDAHAKIKSYDLDGVLVGRGTLGNPWFFVGKTPTPKEMAQAAIEHSELFEKLYPDSPFFPMRKHLAWYLKGFPGAKDLRVRLMQTNSAKEVKKLLSHEKDSGG